jgi:DNA mismatch repair protein MutL
VDGEEKFKTPGDSKLINAIYAIYGKAFADKMIEVKGEAGGIKVAGFVGRSDNARKNRNGENIFINGRYVKSLTAMAALEKAYTSFIAPGYFPTAALMIEMSPEVVDVNVHPSKLEVKFSNEQSVFEAVYYTVKRALEDYEYRPELSLDKREVKLPKENFTVPQVANQSPRMSYSKAAEDITVSVASRSKSDPFSEKESVSPRRSLDILEKYRAAQSENTSRKISAEPPQERIETPTPVSQNTPEYKYIGEAFNCYVMIEYQGDLLIIDKHAAHERIIFEDLKHRREADGRIPSQTLMLPILVTLSPTELAAIEDFRADIESVGFAFTVCDGYAELTAVPEAISAKGAENLFAEMASELSSGETNPTLTEHIRKEKALYQVACKAAIKGGRVYDRALIDWLIGKLLLLPDITVCPHGRPVAYKLTKAELDRKFDRIK